MSKYDALKLFLKKNGKKAADFGEEVGKTGLGAASLGTKKAIKTIKDNPKASSAIGGAVAGAAATKATEDEDDAVSDTYKKLKKKLKGLTGD